MIISGRYNGPPDTGNGGYSAGLVASYVDGPAVVTLRLPPPLDVPLWVEQDGAEVRVYDGERLIATGSPAPPPAADQAVLPPVPLAQAAAAAARYPGLIDHPFPTCYVCGPSRSDGLGVFPGPLDDGRTAAPWTVGPGVDEATVWGVLDCPGGWAVISPGRRYVLGRMAAVVEAMPERGETCVVTGQCTGTDGRKAFVRSAVHASDGTVIGHASATWIAI